MYLQLKSTALLQITFLIFLFQTVSTNSLGQTGTWYSKVTGSNVAFTSAESDTPLLDYSDKYLTVVYLKNTGFNKIGENKNETDISWLLSQGYRVIQLDYANNEKAISPGINQDIIAINDEIASGSFCGHSNCSQYRSYILFEGYRIARDVPFFENDATVYNYPNSVFKDSLRMDIIYPANASNTVPLVLSFSYSNSSAGNANKNQRLNLGYTLAGFNDSFLEGAPAKGMAWAIADHPKYCPWGKGKPLGGANDTYKSYQVNPDAAQKVKAAVRTIRSMKDSLGLSGKIGIYGFSRGSDAGSMAIGDRSDSIMENAGFNIGVSDEVQAALLGPGVFDFTQIYNTLDDGDGNLELRCPWAWGTLEDNDDLWYSMGAAYLVETNETAPTLFFYNEDDSPYYQDQIAKFKNKLDNQGVTTETLVNYGSGHSVPQTDNTLTVLYNFLDEHLTSPVTGSNILLNKNTNNLPLTISPNPIQNELQFSFELSKAGKFQVAIYNMAGTVFFQTEKQYYKAGIKSESISLDEFNLPNGIYLIKCLTGDAQGVSKFIKAS